MSATTLDGVMLTGNHASRPAATAVAGGTLYSCTTHGLIYQSNTSAWSTWATLGAAIADIVDLPTAEMDDTLVLAPDGAGGVEFRAETGGGGSANAHNLNDASALVNATSTGDAGSRADHFPGTSLDAAWVQYNTALSAGPTVKYSSVGMIGTGGSVTVYGRTYTPSGAFRVELGVNIFSASGQGFGLMLADNNATPGAGDAMLAWLNATAGGAEAYSIAGGSLTQQGSGITMPVLNTGARIYLAVERNGSNAWSLYASQDRALWVAMVTGHSKTFTVDKLCWRFFAAAQVALDFVDVVS